MQRIKGGNKYTQQEGKEEGKRGVNGEIGRNVDATIKEGNPKQNENEK